MKNNITIEELKEKLADQYDEVSLLELLNITSTELVDYLEDLIVLKYDELLPLVEGTDDDDDDYM